MCLSVWTLRHRWCRWHHCRYVLRTVRHWCRSVLGPKCLYTKQKPTAMLSHYLFHVTFHGRASIGNWTTRGYANSWIAKTRTGHLADWSTRRLDNSRTSQLTDWTSRGLDNSRSRRCRQTAKLSTQGRRWHPRVVQSVTCPVRELSSPRDVQSASWQSASWRIRELSSNPSMNGPAEGAITIANPNPNHTKRNRTID